MTDVTKLVFLAVWRQLPRTLDVRIPMWKWGDFYAPLVRAVLWDYEWEKGGREFADMLIGWTPYFGPDYSE